MLKISLAQCLKATNKGYFKLSDIDLKQDLSLEDLAFLSEYLNMTTLRGIDLSFKINAENSYGLLNLAQVISKKESLERLNLVIDAVKFNFQFKKNPLLRIFSFIDNNKLKKIDTRIIQATIAMLSNKPNLRKLKLDLLQLENSLNKRQASHFAQNMQKLPLAYLDLNIAIDKGAKFAIFNILNIHLIQFKLGGCQFGSDVLQYLQHAKTLKEFELNTMDLQLEDLRFIEIILKENPGLLFFNLANTNLGQLDSTLVLDSLKDCPSLCLLELSKDNLSQINTESLCKYLAQNPKNLIKLDLSKNVYMPVDAIQIAKALTTNTTLEKLIIDENYIEDQGLQAIIQLLRTNKRITSISMSHNCRFAPSQQTIDALCAFLKEPDCQLIELDFIQNTSASDVKQLLAAIQANTSLVEANLNLSRLGILGEFYQALLDEHFKGLEVNRNNAAPEISPSITKDLRSSRAQDPNKLFSPAQEKEMEEKSVIEINNAM